MTAPNCQNILAMRPGKPLEMTVATISGWAITISFMEKKMAAGKLVYFGNAAVDQVRDTGWFVGQFVPAGLGVRHQTDVELKWGIHADGERRSRGAETVADATTISILIRGSLRMVFHDEEAEQVVTMKNEGDYIIFGPGIVHSWEAVGDTLVVSVRFPSIDVTRTDSTDQQECSFGVKWQARKGKPITS